MSDESSKRETVEEGFVVTDFGTRRRHFIDFDAILSAPVTVEPHDHWRDFFVGPLIVPTPEMIERNHRLMAHLLADRPAPVLVIGVGSAVYDGLGKSEHFAVKAEKALTLEMILNHEIKHIDWPAHGITNIHDRNEDGE
jgi:hypothetical protein